MTLVSTVPCTAAVASGPWFGLCGNVTDLVMQATLPPGTAPFHVMGTGQRLDMGPFSVTPGITADTVVIVLQGNQIWGVSPVRRCTVQ